MIKSGFNPARCDVKLTFYSKTTADNTILEKVETWSVFKTLYGMRKIKPVDETIEGKQEVSRDRVEYVIRYDQSITAAMRFLQDNETEFFEVRSTDHQRRERMTTITAERRDNQEDL